MPLFALAAIALTLAQQPAFEVASVREYKGQGHRLGPLTVTSPLIRLEGCTIFALVLDAYHLGAFQLDFGKAKPEDVAGTMYDISARASGDGIPRLDDVRAMLRTLLADRFKLRTHVEVKERSVYALVVGKTGPTFKPSTSDAPCAVQTSTASDGRNVEYMFTNCPIERLADRLTNLMFEPVLDRTSRTGTYDFRLVAVPEYVTRRGTGAADILPVTAVVELGLRLASRKEKIEILTVEYFEAPAEN